jgi:DNA polymerase III subunit beta
MNSITVNRAELGQAVTFASIGLHKRPGLPVLGGMLVQVSLGTLTLTAFDYETMASAKVPGQASGPAEILVDGKDLITAVRALPKGKSIQAALSLGDTLVIECDGTETTLNAMPLEEYPARPAMPADGGYVDAAAFQRAVQRVSAAAGTDDTLPVLTCVNVACDRGQLELAATDRYRLAVDRITWTGPDGPVARIPAVTLAKFAKAAAKDSKVWLSIAAEPSGGSAGLSDGVRTIITRTNSGEFPRIDKLIRWDTDHSVIIHADAAKLTAAVERAAKLTGRNERMGFDVSMAGQQITVTAMRDGQAAGTQKVTADVDGADVPAGFNGAYLASMLAGFTGTVRIGLNGVKPVQLTAPGDTFRALVMPLRKAV